MSRQLPVPLRPGRVQSERPDVIVVDSQTDGSRGISTFGRLLVSLTPDLIRAVERSLAQRDASRPANPSVRQDARVYRSEMQLTETEYDMRMPFVRKVTVRKASAWTSDTPFVEPAPEATVRRGGTLRRAGMFSVGAVALAAIGLLANRVGNIPGVGWRRGY